MNEYLQEERVLFCPYCGQRITALVDCSYGAQEYYEDCSVCCAPILFSLTKSGDGDSLDIEVKRDDE